MYDTTTTPPPPSAPKRRRWPRIVAFAVTFVIGLVVGAAIGGTDTTPTTTPDRAAGAPIEPEIPESAAEPETPAEPEPYTPTVADFALTIVELERSCFGSAGCNVDYRVELAYGGPDLDPSITYELTYRVLGAEDERTSTIEITGTDYTVDEDFVSVPSGGELSTEILSVTERGF